jgi:tetratricopeptide (TPR) repeat protein
VAEADSVALFLLHARRVSAAFNPSPADLAAIAEICTAVDGMPLAIILAAAWMDTLSPAAIAAQITGQIAGRLQPAAEIDLDFLAAEWTDLPARQRSMRTVLDQSWQLLTIEEQQVLARLAVFRSGFTYAAAQDIAHASLHHLRALVEKSWIHRSAASRYELHELLRQYAEAKLQARPGARSEAYARHCTHFAAALVGWARDLRGKQQLVALAELALEIDNARMAWTWAAQQPDAAGLGKMVDGLCGYFDWRGLCRQGSELCCQALAQLPAVPTGSRPGVKLQLLVWQGRFARLLGDFAAAGAALADALTVLDGDTDVLGDPRSLRAFALHEQALLIVGADRINARELCLASLSLYRALQDLSGVARVLNTLGDLSYCLSQYTAGLAMVEEALAIGRELGDRRLIAESLHRLGLIHATQGEIDLAGRLHEESNAICREIGDDWGLAEGEIELASVWMYSGRFDEAAACYAKAADHYAALGGRSGYTTAVHMLAWACTNLGEYGTAEQHYRRAEELWRADSDRHGIGISRMSLGEIALATGNYAKARVLLTEGIDLLAAVQQRDEEAIGLGDLAAVLHALGQPAAARACVQRSLVLAQAIGAAAPVDFALQAYALILADGGDPARGYELYTFAARHPYVANSRYHADCFGRRIEACAASLSAAEVTGARSRALAGDTATVVQGVLAELEADLAAADTTDRRRANPPAVEPSCRAAQAA